MEEIIQWLEAAPSEKTISTGLALLKAHCRNRNVIDAIERDIKKGAYKEPHVLTSIAYQLSKLANVTPPPVVVATAEVVDPNAWTTPASAAPDSEAPTGDAVVGNPNLIFGDSQLVDLTKLPAALQEKYVGIKDGWKMVSELHTVLQNMKLEDADRAEALDKIIRIKDSIDEAWGQIRAFCDVTPGVQKVEEMPDCNNAAGQDLIDAYKRLVLVRNNIGRAQNELKTLKDAKAIAKRNESIAGWEKETEECKVILAGIQF